MAGTILALTVVLMSVPPLRIRTDSERIEISKNRFQKVSKLREFLAEKLSALVRLTVAGKPLQEWQLLSGLPMPVNAESPVEILCEKCETVSLEFRWRHFTDWCFVILCAPEASLQTIVVLLRRRFSQPPGITTLAVGGSKVGGKTASQIHRKASVGGGKLTFKSDGYQLAWLTIAGNGRKHGLLVPCRSRELDLKSLIQVKYKTITKCLCDLSLEWPSGKENEEYVECVCRIGKQWSDERVWVRVDIGDRQHRFRFPADATVAYCRTRIAKHYRLLWDKFSFKDCNDEKLGQRLREIESVPTFQAAPLLVRINWHFNGKQSGAKRLPLASQICDVKKVLADAIGIEPIAISLSATIDDPTPIDEEERLSMYASSKKPDEYTVAFFVRRSEPVSRLYFRDSCLRCMVDAEPTETFGDIAAKFQAGGPVLFEHYGEVIDLKQKAQRSIHPLDPLSVVHLKVLTVIIGHRKSEEKVFVDVTPHMTVGDLLRLFRCHFCSVTGESQPLNSEDTVLKRNPTLLPIIVRRSHCRRSQSPRVRPNPDSVKPV
jgi:hypothetical protein